MSLSQEAFSLVPLASYLACFAERTWLRWSTEQQPWTCQRGVLDVGWQLASRPPPPQASRGAPCRSSICFHPAMLSMAPAWPMKSCSWLPHHSSSASTPSSPACPRYCTCLCLSHRCSAPNPKPYCPCLCLPPLQRPKPQTLLPLPVPPTAAAP